MVREKLISTYMKKSSLVSNQGYSSDAERYVIILTSSSEGGQNEQVISVSSSSEDNLSSFSDNPDLTSSENSFPITKVNSTTQKQSRVTCIPPYPEPVDVKEIPFDIDGNVVYRLPYNAERRMESSLDGRPWKTWVTSSRKRFAGIRRRANCKGSYKCFNINCSYRRNQPYTV